MGTRRAVAACALAGFAGWAAAANVNFSITHADGRPAPDAVVSLTPAAAVAAPSPSPSPGRIDQVDMEFVPLVTAVRAGTSIEFPNSDNTRHQVYSFSPAKTFNLKLYAGKPAAPVMFDQAGTVVLGCNIHDHMIAWVRVVDTPWFARTSNDGNARLSGLPDGAYTMAIWHPAMTGEPAAEAVQVKDGLRIERRLDLPDIAELRKLTGKY